jgi:hypothetical protein
MNQQGQTQKLDAERPMAPLRLLFAIFGLAAFFYSHLLLTGCAGKQIQQEITENLRPEKSGPSSASSVFPSSPVLIEPLSSQAGILPPPPPGFVLHFIYPFQLTNCYLQSSTDLVNWENRYDFSLETNADGSVGWHLVPDPLKPREFYRSGGEPSR